MSAFKPYYSRICTVCYSLASFISAGVHYSMLNAGLLKMPPYLLYAPEKAYKMLQAIWSARIFRSMLSILVRSPIRRGMLELIDFTVPLPTCSGCVIVICHTPWERLLLQWCLANNFGLIIASGNPTHRNKLIQRKAKGFREMRKIVKHLQQNGRIILAADTFNDLHNCPVQFLGSSFNASLLPARLAGLAKVPLVVALPVMYNGIIHFISGPCVDFKLLKYDPGTIIQNVISFLEKEIIKNPSIWPFYVK